MLIVQTERKTEVKLKEMGGLFPTIFDYPDMWRLNSERCGGKFNLLFWWVYVLLFLPLLPFTLLCLIESALTPNTEDACEMSEEKAVSDGRFVAPSSVVTEEIVRLATTDDPWHTAQNLNALMRYGYCRKCGMVPAGCRREGCGANAKTITAPETRTVLEDDKGKAPDSDD